MLSWLGLRMPRNPSWTWAAQAVSWQAPFFTSQGMRQGNQHACNGRHGESGWRGRDVFTVETLAEFFW